jgi:putative ABC transport system substrate-binding protein
MKRREFLQTAAELFGIAIVSGCGFPKPEPKSASVPRLGLLTLGPSNATLAPLLEAFHQGLSELGYIDGQTISIEWRHGDGKPDQVPRAAAELVATRPDVIAVNFHPAAIALRDATRTIPIVFWNVSDPVTAGLVADLSRPGGNLTGLADVPGGGIYAKRLQLLKETVPTVSRVAVITFPGPPENALLLSEIQTAAQSLKIQIEPIEIWGFDDVDKALVNAERLKVDAIYVMPSAIASNRHGQIADFAIKNGMPTMHGGRAFVEAGGLMSYGSNSTETYRRAATYIDRILRGARPADMPVEANTKFDLVINLSSARAIGLSIPQSVLDQADEFIR